MRIPRDALVRATVRIQERTRSTALLPIFASEDYFWAIDSDNRFDAAVRPTVFTIGQLVDSALYIRSASVDDLASPLHLIWSADLLRGIADGVLSTSPEGDSLDLHLTLSEVLAKTVATLLEAVPPAFEYENKALWSVDATVAYDVLHDPELLQLQSMEELARSALSPEADSASTVRDIASLLELLGRQHFHRVE